MRHERVKSDSIGFGFEPKEGGYHFVVTIPPEGEGVVTVAEHFVFGETEEEAAERARFSEIPMDYPIRSPRPKVEIRYAHWAAVAEEVRADFNRRLLGKGQKRSAWRPGENRLTAYLGKELVLLLWAIEMAPLSDVPTAVANWQGLAPEERWWLYTTINASTGHVSEGRNRGWRKAIQIAFVENPIEQTNYFERSAPPMAHTNGAVKTTTAPRKKRRADAVKEQQPSLLDLAEEKTES